MHRPGGDDSGGSHAQTGGAGDRGQMPRALWLACIIHAFVQHR
jgi:hypothetical protein